MTITIGARPVTLDDVPAVARRREPIAVAPVVRDRLVQARDVVDRLAAAPDSIYGLNSALGANTGARIPAHELAEYQQRAVRARAVGVGPELDAAAVRAIMFARIAGMAAGGSGVSPAVFDALVAMLNRDVVPVVPRTGSISVADLAPLAHIGLAMQGEGAADHGGVRSTDALMRAGLAPVVLGAKDGLALISANAATIGAAALTLHDVILLQQQWLTAVALSCEGFRANLSPLDPRATSARPAPGQRETAADLIALLDGSALLTLGAARRVQDPLSFRAVAQVHGALRWISGEARAQVEIELNSAAESPLVTADGAMLSNGNFHLPALAVALDATAIALAQVASLAVQRCLRFMSPAFTELPLQLTRRGPAHSGFATVQKTLTALWSGIRREANPGSLDFFPVSEGVEDHATLALLGAEKLAIAVEKARYLVAIELLIAAQAIDLRGTDRTTLGAGTRDAYAVVRKGVPVLDVDRPLGPDIDRMDALLRGGALAAVARA
jgi:histidine ammonia-lyase